MTVSTVKLTADYRSEIAGYLTAHFYNISSVKYHRGRVLNCSCAFDTETTSTEINGEKVAIMYAWIFGIMRGDNCYCILGRDNVQMQYFFHALSDFLKLSEDRLLYVYVHNLAFDFQFVKNCFTWAKVFSIKDRKIAVARMDCGIEMRCSYILSGYSLQALGGQLQKYEVEKAVGDLDYSLVRSPETPLTDTEIHYIECDCAVVLAYIQEQIAIEQTITRIPLTKTSYVRRYCRENTIKSKTSGKRYRNIMQGLTLEADEYRLLKAAFAGGFTHANADYVGKTVREVGSADLTSSYPTVEIAEKFPMSKGQQVLIDSRQELERVIDKYCLIFVVEFLGIETKVYYENYISSSKCIRLDGANINNGRVVNADKLVIAITEIDYKLIEEYYTWKSMRISIAYCYKRGYLPTELVRCILDMYRDKTTLKGVSGREYDYLLKKGMLNSNFGMMVTDIVRDEYDYIVDSEGLGNIVQSHADVESSIEKYNKDKSRFLFYPHGVYITAYARQNLFKAISEFQWDYVYSDTDSVKGVNFNRHNNFFNRYNDNIVSKLEKALHSHGLPIDSIRPKNNKGNECLLGVWDYEGQYTYFKTLGAKRYMTYKDDKLSLTVSGLNKSYAVPYLLQKYGTPESVFESFTDNLYIPAEATGKKTHTYIDIPLQGVMRDYLGNYYEYNQPSGIHLSECEYRLTMSDTYITYLINMQKYRGVKK